jgi:hypothetical protein
MSKKHHNNDDDIIIEIKPTKSLTFKFGKPKQLEFEGYDEEMQMTDRSILRHVLNTYKTAIVQLNIGVTEAKLRSLINGKQLVLKLTADSADKAYTFLSYIAHTTYLPLPIYRKRFVFDMINPRTVDPVAKNTYEAKIFIDIKDLPKENA